TVTVTATPAVGYMLDQITVNDDVLNGNSFTMPDGDVTVVATFKKIDYKVSINAGKNGKATLSAATANYGDKITVTCVPDKGYEVDSITVNGNAIKGNTFSMPAKDVTVKVTFKKTVAKVTLTLDKTSAKIVCGSTQTLKATLKNSSSKVAWKSSNSKIASVDSNGKITAKQAGKVTITASAAGVSATCTVQVLFKDVVNEKDFWFTPTYYLVNKGVVKGYDNQTLFKPTNDCSRAQMITFLWRLQGEPAPKSSTNKFKDVKSSDYFYKASIWAVEQGITTVPSDKKFNPQGICTRAQTVTFLWRMAGKPEPKKGINKFSDIKSSDYFYKATLWANEMKIVSGYDDGTFKPQGNCTRRQMVTFLYKYDKYVNGKG
ncbi:MAG: S-layer homology domain-containing protein, partial [Clostridiales bacterium]|nr:S-layer homology domain-containing protein [Clostridiales bacterium]